MGTQPDLSALAVIIVSITLIGALTHEIMRRREMAKEAAESEAAKRAANLIDVNLATNPAAS
jgi:spermidine/putrescine transport system permease protein